MRDINLMDFNGFTVSLLQVLGILAVVVALLSVYFLLVRRVLPWYFDKDNISKRNYKRTVRVVRLVIISSIGILTLRILNIDVKLVDEILQKAMTDDGPPVYLTIKVSTIVEALIAFILANLLDLIIGEFLVQRFYNAEEADASSNFSSSYEEPGRGISRRIQALRPLLYTLAVIFIANHTGISDYYFSRFHDMVGGEDVITGAITVRNILTGVFVLLLIRFCLVVFTTFVLKRYYDRTKLDTGSQFAVNRLLSYFVYLIGVLLVIQAMGFDLRVIWTGAAALLVGIGIGLQQTFNDLICGVIILFERSVKVGDVVELTGHQVGTVRKVGARTSVVETRDDIIIFVPNSKLIGENVTNWSHISRVARFHVDVGVAYGSDTELVKKLLLQAAEDHPKVMKSPKPFVRFLDFGNSSLDFELLFWSRDFIRIENIKSDLRFSIDTAFRTNKVEIPFPQQDLWIRSNTTKIGTSPAAENSDQ